MGNSHEFDLIVIGCGISGLIAAITAAEQGCRVGLISKESSLFECNTFYAQGGIIATSPDDSSRLLGKDITVAGDNLNNREAVSLLAEKGPRLVEEFLVDRLGVDFSRDDSGNIDRTMEAAHSVRRIFHVKDTTGESIERAMLGDAVSRKGITPFPAHTVIDLITNTHNSRDTQQRYRWTRVLGAYVYDEQGDAVHTFLSPAVILATGGVGNLYLHTSNPPGATGDGIAMASRIGAEIVNAEYVQFHPTILFHRDVKRFLISESLRGEGARLKNRKGEFFMAKYEPELKSLAPRDEVSRAIFREMELEGSDYVWLDTQSVKDISLDKRFPAIYSRCMEVGIDIARESIPVVPAAHYFCGGIKVNLWGKTSIPGLYAVGETACTGVHGANRLASVSLLEGLFFGKRAAEEIVKTIREIPVKLKKSIPDWVHPRPEEAFDPILINQDMLNIQNTMWNYAGIIRKQKRLNRALSDLDYLSHRIEKFYKQAKMTRKIIELRNSVLASRIIVRSALSNSASRGCHYVEK
ncbi:MAG: L-aspartate oxidase [Spirochaetales bacterium]|nr:L-aspartate oxidase [Spirochaetales bacterium]